MSHAQSQNETYTAYEKLSIQRQASAAIDLQRTSPAFVRLGPCFCEKLELIGRNAPPGFKAHGAMLFHTERLAEAGIEPSVGSVGDSYDNALAESIKGLYKTEVIRRRGPWRSLEAVEFATLEWVEWFNNRRLLEPIGNMPPAAAEARYYAELETLAIAA